MAIARVTSRGRITIPVEVREALQVGQGDRVEFIEVARGRFELIAAKHSVRALKRLFGRPTASIDQISSAIASRGRSAK
jgi:AbrB family looped-hinge helix DNA binding protein